MALVTTMPMSMSMPIMALMPSGRPVMSRAAMAPMMASGRLKRMMKGSSRLPKTMTITM